MCECGLRFVVSRSMWHMATYSTCACGTECVCRCATIISLSVYSTP